MKKILTIFFVTLGVIFFVLILFGTYFYVADPYNLKPQLFGSGGAPAEQQEAGQGTTTQTTETNSQLSPEQEQAAEAFGVETSNISFTEEQTRCFEEILGTARVEEIKAGSSPTPSEFFRVQSCL